MVIHHFYDEATSTLTYVVHEDGSRSGVVIDSLTDYDPRNGRTSYESCRRVAEVVDGLGLRITHVLDTHVHADHLTGMPFFRERYGSKTVIGSEIRQVQSIFRSVFNLGPEFRVDGSQFDVLLGDGEILEAGKLRIEALHTPGHTPACLTYRIGDALFVGDVIFMPDYGTARCDFPAGSAHALYRSIRRLYAFPDETRVFTGHDYRPGGRSLRCQSTIGEQKSSNVQLRHDTTEEEFVAFRTKRDAGLDAPTLILPSLQVNIRAGALPEPESNGKRYLKIPLNVI